MADKIEELKFLAEKSNQLVARQVDAYRQAHGKAGTIIGVIALFIPFFLTGLEDASTVIKVMSILPVTVLCCAMLLLLLVLRSSPLKQGIDVRKLPELINKDHQNVLLFEIAANRKSFEINNDRTKRSNDKYNLAVVLTIVAILFSAGLLMTNKFTKPDDKPINIQTEQL